MREAKLDDKARAEIRHGYLRRLRAVQLARTARRFTPMPGKKRLSKRGLPHPSYFTKAHTPSRRRDLKEAREAT